MLFTVVIPSLCTMVALQWEPQIIAVAVMYLAGRLCKFDIQEWTSKQSSRRWWEQFVHDVPVEVLEGNMTSPTQFVVEMELVVVVTPLLFLLHLEDICHQILDLYSQAKQQMPDGGMGTGENAPPYSILSPLAPPPAKKTSPQNSPRPVKPAQVCGPSVWCKYLSLCWCVFIFIILISDCCFFF